MRIRRHLTYANVLATVTLFIVLGGGAALAAGQLGKNSVGAKQLKKNAVTTAKIKKNAVTTAKLAENSVPAAKVKAGSLKGSDLSPSLPYGHIAQAARGNSVVALPPTGVVYPLEGATFTQQPGTALTALGGVEISISAGCKDPSVYGELFDNQPEPLTAVSSPEELGTGLIGAGEFESEATGPLTARFTVSPYLFSSPFGVAPASPTQHTLALVLSAECTSGTGITATFGGVDVIANGEV